MIDMNYTGILLVTNKNKNYQYIDHLSATLSEVCETVKVIVQEEFAPNAWMKLGLEAPDRTRGVIIARDTLLGAVLPLSQTVQKLQNQFDIWGLAYDMTVYQQSGRKQLRDDFIVMESGAFARQSREWTVGALYDQTRNDEQKEMDEWVHLPYTLMVESHLPFLLAESFSVMDGMNYTIQHELRRAVDTLAEGGEPLDWLWEYLIAETDPYDLKRILHLEYVQAESETVMDEPDQKVAVFAHLYYEDLYDKCLNYLQRIPFNIDLYLSTPPNRIPLLQMKIKRQGIRVQGIFPAGTRGRDAGALLLAFRPYLRNYQYICFLHDKKSSGGLSPRAEGLSFMELVWDNLLGGEKGIRQIIRLFEKNRFLGIVAPPTPIMGSYLKFLIGNEWTVCYEETLRLAEKLGVVIHASEKKQPCALSTCFWCRPESLEDLFQYDWKPEDFSPEPIKIDGEINHAIERILPYLAQNRGFYSAVTYTPEYASIYTCGMMYLLDDVFGQLHKSFPTKIQVPLNLAEHFNLLSKLTVFVGRHSKLFVYGAGAQAKILKKKLDELEIQPCCYLVTESKRNADRFEGYEVKQFSEAAGTMDKNAGIILALSSKYANQVIPEIQKYGFDYFFAGTE